MELFTLQYVLAVAEYRKFSLAAQACYIGQPALSQQIAKLEKELGVTLFVRNAHTVTLTEPGKEFVLRAKEILQSVSALQAEMNRFAGLRKGKLNVGVITSLQCINFGGMLSTFFTRYPGIDMNIVQSGTYDLIKQLNEHSLDVAFMNRPVSRLPSTLQFHKLGEDRYSLAVPKTHPLSRREYVSLRELKNERFIFHQTGQVAFELCRNACRNAGFEPHIVCHSENPTIGLYMVQGGLGLAFLPTEEFEHHRIDNIAEVKIIEPIIKEVGIAWRQDSSSPLVDTIVQRGRPPRAGDRRAAPLTKQHTHEPDACGVQASGSSLRVSERVILNDVVAHLLRRGRKGARFVIGEVNGAHEFLVPLGDRDDLDAVCLHRRHPRHDRHAEAQRDVLDGAVALAHLKDDVGHDVVPRVQLLDI